MEKIQPGAYREKAHGDILMPVRRYRCVAPYSYRELPLHWHEEMEAAWIEEGSIRYDIGFESFTVQKDDILLISPHVLHSAHAFAGTEMISDSLVFHLDLLGGRVPGVAEHLRQYTRGEGEGEADCDTAIALVTRTTMFAYARGIRQGATGKASLHQATLYRLLIEAMQTLLHDRPMPLTGFTEADGLASIFIRACRSEHNFHVMAAEMDNTYIDLVKNEGIISQDDNAN